MSKRFNREENIIDRLQKENRELKTLNKSLMKRLKKVSRGYYHFLNQETDDDKADALAEVTKDIKKICFLCGTGEYKEIIIHNRRWRQCVDCGKRGKVKIINEKVKS